MREGPEVYRMLQRRSQDAQSAVGEASAAVQRVETEIQNLVLERGKAVDELARHYLPELSDDAIASAFAEVRHQLEAVQARRERRLAELRTALESSEAQRAELEGALEAVTTALDEQVVTRDRLEAEVAVQLQADPEFVRLSTEAAQAQVELERNEERATEIADEGAEKRPSYEDSRLFMYLWKRKFATTGYVQRGLTRRLDRWVAELIEFRKARLGYEYLCVTPELVEHEVTRRRAAFEQLMEQVEALEDAADDDAGLTAVRIEGERLGAEREQTEGKIAANAVRNREIGAELTPIERSRGEYYADALRRLKQFLEHAETSSLAAGARDTTTQRDDRLVAELRIVGSELATLEPRLAELEHREHNAREHNSDLEGVLARFRSADYDSPRSYFDDFDPDLTVTTETHRLWSELERRQHFRPPPMPDFRGPFDSRQRGRPSSSRSLPSTTLPSAGGGVGEALAAAGSVLGQIARSPVSRVLMHAMGEVVGQALRGAVGRGVARRSGSVSRQRTRRGRPRSGGGFTTGGGF